MADASNKKREEFELRMKQREAERLEKLKEKENKGQQNENGNNFWNIFNHKKTETANEVPATQAKALQQILNSAMHYLSPYDVRKAQEMIQALQVETQVQSATEKKKFSFSKKKTDSTTSSKPATPKQGSAPLDANITALHEAQHITGLQDQIVYIGTNAILETSKLQVSIAADDTYIVSNCHNCTLYICSTAGSARFEKLKNCRIFVAPVKRALYIDACQQCTFHIAAHQARIHTSEHCDFYVFAKTSPIIEHCNNVRFAPYDFTYAEQVAHFQQATFDMQANLWQDVKDFNWIKLQASPHWSVIPEQERKSVELPAE